MMKIQIKIFFILFALISASNIFAQTAENSLEIEHSNTPNGLRVKKGTTDYIIYLDNNLNIDFSKYRKLNPNVYFRKLNNKKIIRDSKTYVLISIPGVKKSQIENINGNYINNSDLGKNYWIEELDIVESNLDKNYTKYSNDFFSGLLTAPFKYRLGNSDNNLIDGDFNIAPFLGWKFRVGQIRPYYIAPFLFGGITTLKYNSANNSKISDPTVEENSSGFTYGFGVSFRLGSISPGLLVGYDKGTGNLGSGFIHNKKPWLSFSLNYDFFTSKEKSKVTN